MKHRRLWTLGLGLGLTTPGVRLGNVVQDGLVSRETRAPL